MFSLAVQDELMKQVGRGKRENKNTRTTTTPHSCMWDNGIAFGEDGRGYKSTLVGRRSDEQSSPFLLLFYTSSSPISTRIGLSSSNNPRPLRAATIIISSLVVIDRPRMRRPRINGVIRRRSSLFCTIIMAAQCKLNPRPAAACHLR